MAEKMNANEVVTLLINLLERKGLSKRAEVLEEVKRLNEKAAKAHERMVNR